MQTTSFSLVTLNSQKELGYYQIYLQGLKLKVKLPFKQKKIYKKIIVYTGVEQQRRNLENRLKNAAICITTEFEENGSSRYLDG